MAKIQTLPGFHDFYPEDLKIRNYLFEVWRRVAHRHGFVEYEAPTVESAELYRRKSGDEILSQLFHFEDKGGREMALRPELTPSLARMASARLRDYRKPLKWFQIGPCFRAERPQKGRRREFIQFNADILGDAGTGADAELAALAIETLREFGFGTDEVVLRLSNRDVWNDFLAEQGISFDRAGEFLTILDKLERDPEGVAAKLATLGTSTDAVREFIARDPDPEGPLGRVLADLEARGLATYVETDLSIVRGLAYYTGTVFEVFDRARSLRAVAGGGRYNDLAALVSDGAVDLPAIGFAMGNVVLGDLIDQCAEAKVRLLAWLDERTAAQVYVMIADEASRPHALAVATDLRRAGLRVDLPLSPLKFNKQFQAAEAVGARVGVIIGSEFPAISVKDLHHRREVAATADTLAQTVADILAAPGPLIA